MHTNTLVSLLAIASAGFVSASPVPKSVGVNPGASFEAFPHGINAPRNVPVPAANADPSTGNANISEDNFTPPTPGSTPAYAEAYHTAHGRRKAPEPDVKDPSGTSGVNVDDVTPPTPGSTPVYIEAHHVAGEARGAPALPVAPPALPVKAPVRAPAPPALPAPVPHVPRNHDGDDASVHLEERSKKTKGNKEFFNPHLWDFAPNTLGDMRHIVPKGETIPVSPLKEKVSV